jgi:hypothetical protein
LARKYQTVVGIVNTRPGPQARSSLMTRPWTSVRRKSRPA